MKTIIAFGNPLLDITVNINNNLLLTKYDLKPDGAKEVEKHVMANLLKDIEQCDQYLSAGGCAQNTIRVIQWLLEKKCNVFMFGSVGNDKEAIKMRQLLENDGIQTRYFIQDNLPTGNSVALVNNSQRSLVAYLGAAEHLPLDDLQNNENVLNILRNTDYVYIEGFFLTKRKETAKFLLDYCNKHKKTVIFNISNEYMCEKYADIVIYFVEKASIVFGNEREFCALCKVMNKTDIDTLAKELIFTNYDKIIIVTNGCKPVTCFTLKQKIVHQVPKIEDTELADTTGAGDAFVAGFIAGKVLNKSISICLKIGCYASLNIIKQTGCTLPDFKPNLDILDE